MQPAAKSPMVVSLVADAVVVVLLFVALVATIGGARNNRRN